MNLIAQDKYPIAFLIFASVVLTLTTGCKNPDEIIEIDPAFSINVTAVPAWYPGENYELTPAETEVFELYGRPEFFHHNWTVDGEFYTSSDFSGRQADLPQILEETKNSWVYYRSNIEIEFPTDGQYLEHPLREQIKILCRNGDPSTKSPPKYDKAGRKLETWMWVDRGLEIRFVDGIEMSRKHFTPTGSGTWRIK